MIYLASPYTDESMYIRRMRFLKVCAAAAELTRQGKFVFSPIAHTVPMAEFGLPSTWDYWKQYDEKMIALCDELYVLQLDGWQRSAGVNAEVEMAKAMGKPIKFVTEKELGL